VICALSFGLSFGACRFLLSAFGHLRLRVPPSSRCELLLNGTEPKVPNGDVLLDELLGPRIHWIQPAERVAKLRDLPDQLRKEDRKPYVIPVGGPNGVGAIGYVLAMIELVEQLDKINRRVDHVVFASSSGGTQAGIVVGAKVTGFNGRLHGVSIDKNDRDGAPYEHELAEIANETVEYIGFDAHFTPRELNVL
jgi:L-cysteate sulfo-lyase